jgi:hypothetical protein
MDDLNTQLQDEVQKLSSGAKRQEVKTKKMGGSVKTAKVLEVDGVWHKLAEVNLDNSLGTEYNFILSQDGTVYPADTIVQLYFGAVSPLPKIIGVASGGDTTLVVVSSLGFNG